MRLNQLLWMIVAAASLVLIGSVMDQAHSSCIDQNNDFMCDQTYDPVPTENDRIRQRQEEMNRNQQRTNQIIRPAYSVEPMQYTYDDYMQCGYMTTEQKSYPIALYCFTAALSLRPGDGYAQQAIANINRYIAGQQRQAAEQQRRSSEAERENSVRSFEFLIAGITSVQQLQTLTNCIHSAMDRQHQENCNLGIGMTLSVDGSSSETERNQRKLQIIQSRILVVNAQNPCSSGLLRLTSVCY